MSEDAKSGKKDLLKSKGVEVVEYTSDYSKAVEEGREKSQKWILVAIFVDDENPSDLFLGCGVGGIRLKTIR